MSTININAIHNQASKIALFKYKIEEKGDVKIYLKDSVGRVKKELVNRINHKPGSFAFKLDLKGVLSGVYDYVLELENKQVTKKLIVI